MKRNKQDTKFYVSSRQTDKLYDTVGLYGYIIVTWYIIIHLFAYIF